MAQRLLPDADALQHEPAPRPLPLFLELVRKVSETDPALARDALAGLRAYQVAQRPPAAPDKPTIAGVRGASIRDHGGTGPPVVLVPSLINPPRVLDLDAEVSLASGIARMGRRSLLLDWGPAAERSDLSVSGHVEHLLLPLLAGLGTPAALVGYCLGGTMAIAAANLTRCDRVVTLAAPWNFSAYPEASRQALDAMWRRARAPSRSLGALPMEVLQAAFWSLDPVRTVLKFAEFGRADPASAAARRFVALEDWANAGEALPFPAAAELIECLFGDDLPGSGRWTVAGEVITDQLPVPALHVLASNDRIAPPATAAAGHHLAIASGHVGMIVGSARVELHRALAAFLAPLAARSGGG